MRIGIFLALAALLIAGCAGGGATPAPVTSAATTPSPATPVSQAPAATPTPAKFATSKKSYEFTGSGGLTTQPFSISGSQWLVKWSAEAQEAAYGVNLFVFIYPKGETAMHTTSIQATEKTGEKLIPKGEGDYYMVISTGNVKKWILEVWE